MGLTASDAKSSAELQRAYRQRQREQAELDARLARHKFEVDRYITDLGGADALSAVDKATIHVVATLTLQLQDIEARMNASASSTDDLSLYNRVSGNMRRLLTSLPKRARGTRVKSLEQIAAEMSDND